MTRDDDVLPPVTVYRDGEAISWPEALGRARTAVVLDLERRDDSPGFARDWDQVLSAFDDTGPFDRWLIASTAGTPVPEWHGDLADPGDSAAAWQGAMGMQAGETRGVLVVDDGGAIMTRIVGGPTSDAVDWVRTAIASQRLL